MQHVGTEREHPMVISVNSIPSPSHPIILKHDKLLACTWAKELKDTLEFQEGKGNLPPILPLQHSQTVFVIGKLITIWDEENLLITNQIVKVFPHELEIWHTA